MEPTLILLRGEPAAVSAGRWAWLAPHLDPLPNSHPDRAWVLWLSLLASEVRRGHLPGPFDQETAERWLRRALIEDRRFIQLTLGGAELDAIAAEFRVPVEQVSLKHDDLETNPEIVEDLRAIARHKADGARPAADHRP